VPSLAYERLLPRADRELLAYEITRFHLDDVNALAERRRSRRGRSGWSAADIDRTRAIVRAARWQPKEFLAGIRRFVDEGRARVEDAFGPALLLLALGADRDAVVMTLPPRVDVEVRDLLDKIDRLQDQRFATTTRRGRRRPAKPS
jgi:hypothetical protein